LSIRYDRILEKETAMKIADLVNASSPRDKLLVQINVFCQQADEYVKCWEKYSDCAALRVLMFTLGKVNGLCFTYVMLYGEDEQVQSVSEEYHDIFDRVCSTAAEFHLTKRQS